MNRLFLWSYAIFSLLCASLLLLIIFVCASNNTRPDVASTFSVLTYLYIWGKDVVKFFEDES